MITDMYTDDCVVWDAKRNAIDEAKLDKDLRKMAGNVSCKQMAGSKHVHDEDIDEDEEGDDGDSSMFEDLDKPLPAPAKRSGKAKSPAKSGPVNWIGPK